MTKAELFIQAWELVITKEDSSLVDKFITLITPLLIRLRELKSTSNLTNR